MTTTRSSEELGRADFDKFGEWYSTRRRRLTGRPASPNTVRTKQVWVRRSAKALNAVDGVSLAVALSDRETVEVFLAQMEAKVSSGTLRSVVYALRDFGEYAVANGWIDRYEVRKDDVPPANPAPPITVYSPEEMERFRTAALGVGLRWWAFISFLTGTSRRVGEALSLRWEWFRLDAPVPYIELPTNKSGEPQYIPLTKELREEVFSAENIAILKAENKKGRMAYGRDPELFPFPWDYRSVYFRLQRFCDRTGLPNRGFHNFRHTVITDRIARGVPLQAVSALAGHTNIATTAKRYNHTNALHFARYLEEPDE